MESVAARERALVQRQAGQASAAEEEEARLVKEAQALDAQRAELQAQLAEAKQGISHLKSRVLACASTPDAPLRKSLPDRDLFLTNSPSCSLLTQHGNAAWQLPNAQDSVKVQAVNGIV